MGVDKDAFLKVFEEHSDGLFRHAFFRLSSRDKALDLTQDAFLKGWEYIRKGGDMRDPKNFLYRIMHNLIIDEYRKSKSDSLDEVLEKAGDATEEQFAEGSLAEIESSADDRMLTERVKNAVAELPDDYRAIVTLRFMEELSTKEIAPIVGVTENVVSVRIHRALIKLRGVLLAEENI